MPRQRETSSGLLNVVLREWFQRFELHHGEKGSISVVPVLSPLAVERAMRDPKRWPHGARVVINGTEVPAVLGPDGAYAALVTVPSEVAEEKIRKSEVGEEITGLEGYVEVDGPPAC